MIQRSDQEKKRGGKMNFFCLRSIAKLNIFAHFKVPKWKMSEMYKNICKSAPFRSEQICPKVLQIGRTLPILMALKLETFTSRSSGLALPIIDTDFSNLEVKTGTKKPGINFNLLQKTIFPSTKKVYFITKEREDKKQKNWSHAK